MDGLAIACVILLSIVTGTQILGLFLWFRATARRQQQADALQSTVENIVDRMIEIESTAKSFGPAIERSTGETANRLVDAIASINALSTPIHDQGKQLREHASALNAIVDAINSGAERNSTEASESLAILERLATAATQTESTGKNVVTCVGSLESRVSATGRDLGHRLDQLDAHLASLRSELKQATQF